MRKYILTDEAKVSPVELTVFKGDKPRNVAVGGKIILKEKPPIRGEIEIQEATQAERKELYERGYTHLIQIEEIQEDTEDLKKAAETKAKAEAKKKKAAEAKKAAETKEAEGIPKKKD